MKRVVFAAFIASLIIMLWGSIFWLGLPSSLHGIKAATYENNTLALLARELPASGVYVLPFPPADMTDENFREKHKAGPIAHIFYKVQGHEPLDNKVLLSGWLQAFLSSLLMAVLVAMVHRGLPTFAKRWLFVSLTGIFACIAMESLYPVWWHHQWGFHLSIMLQQIIGWILAGSIIAAIVKVPD
jgi:hypothetical protein